MGARPLASDGAAGVNAPMMVDASVLIVRIVAVLHFAMAIVGAGFLSTTAYLMLPPHEIGAGHDWPYVARFFWAYTTMNAAFVAGWRSPRGSCGASGGTESCCC
jgi:hypothetical protein